MGWLGFGMCSVDMGIGQNWVPKQLYLIGGLEHFVFFHMLGITIPIDELHHFSEG